MAFVECEGGVALTVQTAALLPQINDSPWFAALKQGFDRWLCEVLDRE